MIRSYHSGKLLGSVLTAFRISSSFTWSQIARIWKATKRYLAKSVSIPTSASLWLTNIPWAPLTRASSISAMSSGWPTFKSPLSLFSSRTFLIYRAISAWTSGESIDLWWRNLKNLSISRPTCGRLAMKILKHPGEQSATLRKAVRRTLRSAFAHSSIPSITMRPLSGVSNPAIIRSNVVLPQPEGPSSA